MCKHYQYYPGVWRYPDGSGEPDHAECAKEHNWCWRSDPQSCPNAKVMKEECPYCKGEALFYHTVWKDGKQNYVKTVCVMCDWGKFTPDCHCEVCIEQGRPTVHHGCGEDCPDYEYLPTREDCL